MLLSESSSHVESSVPVISIVGMGGIGKTTLAQYIFNADKVVNHFEKKMWVCVSETFDLKRIVKAIVEEVGDGNVPNLTTWQAWHNHLCESLEGKLFLLVLDDAWTEDRDSWDKLKLALDCGKKGSRIVVTTRNDTVALTVGTTDKHNLQQLSNDDCWLLFEHLAFEGRRGESDHQRLKSIGRKLSDRCKGVPLYAKTLGSLMPRKRTVEDWEDVLASDIWKLPTVSKCVLPPLLLSYNALPSHLKRCFTYCAVFPKDHEIYKDHLIKMWMAEGCLRSSQMRKLESIGAEFFDELVMCSFFQNLEMDVDGNVSKCKMHDLIHNFATFLANNECLVVGSSEINFIHSKTRHLSVMLSAEDEGRIPLSIWNLKSLRTLLVWNSNKPRQSSIDCKDLNLLSHLTSLRTLNLSGALIKKLPKEIEKLIHLRYLDLSDTKLEEVPETVGNLSILQTLKLNQCSKLLRLPNDMGKMVSLRHLEAEVSGLEEVPETVSKLSNLQTLKLNGCIHLQKLPNVTEKMVSLRHLEIDSFKGWSSLKCIPRGIGKLRDLETLSEFIVSEEGADIGELKDLNNLRGKLIIRNIESVGKEASHEAILKDKEYLRHLELRFNSKRSQRPPWSWWYDDDDDDEAVAIHTDDDDDDEAVKSVFELLEPHPNLDKLGIYYYNGSTFPSWMEFPNWEGRFIMLRQLIISKCKNLKVLPALGRLEFLEFLELVGLDSISQMGLEVLGVLNGDSSAPVIAFPKLKMLSIRKMKHWEEWVIKTTVNITVMPLLQTLIIRKMKHWEEWVIKTTVNITVMPLLQTLIIRSYPLLKSLPCQILSNSLREMTIGSCPHLEFSCLPPFLEKLELCFDAGSLLLSLPIQNDLHSNLKSLVIQSSPHSTLPQGLSQLKALQTLRVSHCNSLSSMSEELQHLTSLHKLDISDCHILGPRCEKEVGEDWSIISHIPVRNVFTSQRFTTGFLSNDISEFQVIL